MTKYFVPLIVLVTAIVVANAAGLIPPQLAAAAGVLSDDVQTWVIDQIGPEKVYLYQADQAVAAARKQERVLLQDTATKRVDHDLAKDKLAEVRGEEIALRANLTELGGLIEAEETVELDNGDVWTPSRIKEFAAREVERHKTLVEQIGSYEETVQLYADTADMAEATLINLRQDLATVEAKRDLLAALISQGALLKSQSSRSPETAAALAKTQSDIQSLIDSQRRANLIAQEMSRLSLPVMSTPLVEQQDQALLDYINGVTSLAAGR